MNYCQHIEDTPFLQLIAFGSDALTRISQALYADGENPYFGLLCGDSYLTSPLLRGHVAQHQF